MNSFDLEIAARTVWMEARGEGEAGLRAVAAVIINRTKRKWRGAQTMAEVCLQPLQFSCWNTSDPNRVRMARLKATDPLLLSCLAYVQDAAAGLDPTNGAVLYCAKAVAPSVYWVKSATQVSEVGRHVFYSDQTLQLT
jgi:N-acetylmuramoyl-L-alanine amidase